MKHMREPTDEEIAEEIAAIRENERIARRPVKCARDVEDFDENVSTRLERLETAHEVQTHKMSRLEEMICDLHSAKFGHRHSEAGRNSMDVRRESGSTPSPIHISSEANSDKAPIERTDNDVEDIGECDRYNIGRDPCTDAVMHDTGQDEGTTPVMQSTADLRKAAEAVPGLAAGLGVEVEKSNDAVRKVGVEVEEKTVVLKSANIVDAVVGAAVAVPKVTRVAVSLRHITNFLLYIK